MQRNSSGNSGRYIIKEWIKNKKLYRNHDLPAMIENDIKVWCANSIMRRNNNPAMIYHNGCKEWCFNKQRMNRKPPIYKSGKLTCVFPCKINFDGTKNYFIEGKLLSDVHNYYNQQNCSCSIQ